VSDKLKPDMRSVNHVNAEIAWGEAACCVSADCTVVERSSGEIDASCQRGRGQSQGQKSAQHYASHIFSFDLICHKGPQDGYWAKRKR
jgi:hypothetical protein